MAVLISRLVYLQVYQHDLYATLSRNNQVNVIPKSPTRGLIFDRNGILLAENVSSFSLSLTPKLVPDIDAYLEQLKDIVNISEQEIEQFHKLRAYKKRHDPVPLRYKLTEVEVAKFYTERHRFPGVEVTADLTRHYPLDQDLAHVIGYIGPINEKESLMLDNSDYQATYYIGKTGIEKEYEHFLHGKPGYEQLETDARGRAIRSLGKKYSIPGKDIYITIDSKLQKVANKAFKGKRGALVALVPESGEVLAMISAPSFNPNLFVQGINYKNYNDLRQSTDQPLFNRAIMGQYPPASTIKPIIGLKALQEKIVTSNKRIYCPGWFRLDEEVRLHRDWKKKGHSWSNLNKAIAESCDVYFYTIANELGIDNLHEVFTTFGLGKITGIDLAPEASGLVPSREWKKMVKNSDWYRGETLNIGIGQGYMLATPLQMAQMAATIANKGLLPKPHLLYKFKQDIAINIDKQLKEISIDFKSEHWKKIILAMENVIQSPKGTAHRISNNLKYSLAGKTGTAQVFSLGEDEDYEAENIEMKLRDHSWFIAFAPIEKPKIAIAAIVENSGGASSIVRKVLDQYFKQEAIQ